METALAELYRETGYRPYLELASQWIEQRGHGRIGSSGFGLRYLQDHQPVRETSTEVGHVVRALYLEAGVADVAAETGDAALLRTSIDRWADMIATKTYLTGGNGSRHEGESFGDRFELPPDRAYNETCAAIASFQWAWRLLLATGEGKYADHMERILYNGFAGAIATGGTRFFYVNPLQRRADHFEKDDPGRRREWFSCACCPPNIMRLTASLQNYLATVAGRHAVPAPVQRRGAGRPAGRRRAGRAGGHRLPVVRRGRDPGDQRPARTGWARAARAGLGQPARVFCSTASRCRPTPPVRGTWCWSGSGSPATCCSYELDVTPRLTIPDRRIDAVRGTAAIERGPLVYCFEQADQPAGADLEDLALVPGDLGERAVTVPGVGPTVLIEAAALRQPTHRAPAHSVSGLPYQQHPEATTPAANPAGDQVTATAIPYFQWDNRDGQAMRVWLPLAQPTS